MLFLVLLQAYDMLIEDKASHFYLNPQSLNGSGVYYFRAILIGVPKRVPKCHMAWRGIALFLALHWIDRSANQSCQFLCTLWHPPKIEKSYYIPLKTCTVMSSFNYTCMKILKILTTLSVIGAMSYQSRTLCPGLLWDNGFGLCSPIIITEL